jgi:hypothetical protein
MVRSRGSFLLVAIAIAVLARDARAGVVVFTESEPSKAAEGAKDKAAKPRYQGQFSVEGDRVRLQGTSNEADGVAEGTVLFQPKPEALIFLDAGDKSYMEMTRADAKRIGASIEAARTQMQAQLEKMTPEQRAVVEQAMASAGGAAMGKAGKPKKAPEPAKASATGASDKVGPYSCRVFDVTRGGKKIAEACVSSWADVGFSQADVDGLKKLATFQHQLFTEVNVEGFEAAPGAEAFEVMDQLQGFPVRVRTVGGKQPIAMRVVKIERKPLDAKVFDIPAGYTKRSMAEEE